MGSRLDELMSLGKIEQQAGENTGGQYAAITTKAPGPEGILPLTGEMLRESPSGHLFGLSQNVGMGWKPEQANGPSYLILGNTGGIRRPDGSPVALGYHSGHWETGLLMEEAAAEFTAGGGVPFAGFVSDPCDGRSQGTAGMFDSLPYRNDAAIVLRRLIRSLPGREGVLGVATCDKGLPAMMMALAAMRDLSCILVPGGVMLPPVVGEDAGKVQSIGARYANGELALEDAAELGCRACASPGGGCQFLGTAATSQVVAEALGLALPHSALAPSGQPVWQALGRQSARALRHLAGEGIRMKHILTEGAIRNAMAVHAAFGGSTNLLLHLPAVAHAAGLPLPTVEDWKRVNREVPRLVSVLPNGPVYHPTVRVFLAGGVPEVMLHLRQLGKLDESVLTVTGETLKENLDWWEHSARRQEMRQRLLEADGVDPDEVILPPELAAARGLTPTVTFPTGNLAPEGSVVKSTSIDPSVVGEDGVYRHMGPARVFTSEREAMKALKNGSIAAGDVLVVIGCGPSGTGMEETYQLTSALKHLSYGKYVPLLTDARFSGVSTGACIGHIGPEALAGGPVGKLRTGDQVEIVINTRTLEGHVNYRATAENGGLLSAEQSALELAARSAHPGLSEAEGLPEDTRLWAALQSVSGGTWKGCVYDTEKIIAALQAGALR